MTLKQALIDRKRPSGCDLGGHIEGVSAAHPRSSLRDPDAISVSVSGLCFSGHKTTRVVTAGILWDNISQEGILQVIQNSETLVDRILEKIT
jgi:hypothetical protein